MAQKKSAPIEVEHLRKMVAEMDLESPRGLRDRAMLCVGFGAGLRRSELVGLDVSDVEWRDQGIILNIRKSKTDQEAQGRRVAIVRGSTELCPVAALRAWLDAAHIAEGPLFRPVNKGGVVGVNKLSQRGNRLSEPAVDTIVKKLAGKAQLVGHFSAHSLRAGLVTAAAAAGLPESDSMRQTGHRDVKTHRGYYREGSLFRNNVSGLLGL